MNYLVGESSNSNLNCRGMQNFFSIYLRAGKFPTGSHLEIVKYNKVIQKVMVDEKKCYFFYKCTAIPQSTTQIIQYALDDVSCSKVNIHFSFLTNSITFKIGVHCLLLGAFSARLP